MKNQPFSLINKMDLFSKNLLIYLRTVLVVEEISMQKQVLVGENLTIKWVNMAKTT